MKINLTKEQISEALALLVKSGEVALLLNIKVDYVVNNLHSSHYLIMEESKEECNYKLEDIKNVIYNYHDSYANKHCQAGSKSISLEIYNLFKQIDEKVCPDSTRNKLHTFTKLNITKRTPIEEINKDNYEFLKIDELQNKYTFINFTTFIKSLTKNYADEKVQQNLETKIRDLLIVEKNLLDKMQNLFENSNVSDIIYIYMYVQLLKQLPRKGELTQLNLSEKQIEVL